jgi:catechol 2,3-dioxygenase-like lactoylglutathione lyase family enzyme
MSFFEALQSAGPASDRADKMGLYGWLAGDWTMEGTVHAADGSRHEVQGHLHAGWVLEGRAIQDVWILPGFFHGSTLRVYDPNLDAWHILWSDPLKQYFVRQIGRAQGADIVQEGRNEAGEAIRWRFTDITKNSFCWSGERSLDDGETWQLQARFLARRVAVPEVKPMLDHVSIGVSFWLYAVACPVPPAETSGLHFCFAAPSREGIDAFHAAALRSGGRDNGQPGLRLDYGPDYYAAFVVDPDGYRIEAHHGG